ncbi:DNA-3-methyladenine glycosylase I [Streptomyces axinellae]|uniref:DNA-3-methyladenine glycosylase I n=1 Tax=Streptomyces axinellae TaxID=552788 RepID=A0ABN3PVF2_9ACTN
MSPGETGQREPGRSPATAPDKPLPEGGARPGPDGRLRCPWGTTAEDYAAYHDTEWGRAVHGDDALFERLCLEGFQSGLSWLTILRKREAFRAAFAGFHIPDVAKFTEADERRLLADSGIVRNRLKIGAVLNNARVAAEWEPGELDRLVWSYAPDHTERPVPRTVHELPATTPESTALSKDLKKRGFRFVGPTTAYALIQACGLVNDHLADCWRRAAED